MCCAALEALVRGRIPSWLPLCNTWRISEWLSHDPSERMISKPDASSTAFDAGRQDMLPLYVMTLFDEAAVGIMIGAKSQCAANTGVGY